MFYLWVCLGSAFFIRWVSVFSKCPQGSNDVMCSSNLSINDHDPRRSRYIQTCLCKHELPLDWKWWCQCWGTQVSVFSRAVIFWWIMMICPISPQYDCWFLPEGPTSGLSCCFWLWFCKSLFVKEITEWNSGQDKCQLLQALCCTFEIYKVFTITMDLFLILIVKLMFCFVLFLLHKSSLGFLISSLNISTNVTSGNKIVLHKCKPEDYTEQMFAGSGPRTVSGWHCIQRVLFIQFALNAGKQLLVEIWRQAAVHVCFSSYAQTNICI